MQPGASVSVEIPGDGGNPELKGEPLASPVHTPREEGGLSPGDASARKRKGLLSKIKSSFKRKEASVKKSSRDSAASPGGGDSDQASPRAGDSGSGVPPRSRERSSWRRLSRTKSGGQGELPTPRKLGIAPEVPEGDEEVEEEAASGESEQLVAQPAGEQQQQHGSGSTGDKPKAVGGSADDEVADEDGSGSGAAYARLPMDDPEDNGEVSEWRLQQLQLGEEGDGPSALHAVKAAGQVAADEEDGSAGADKPMEEGSLEFVPGEQVTLAEEGQQQPQGISGSKHDASAASAHGAEEGEEGDDFASATSSPRVGTAVTSAAQSEVAPEDAAAAHYAADEAEAYEVAPEDAAAGHYAADEADAKGAITTAAGGSFSEARGSSHEGDVGEDNVEAAAAAASGFERALEEGDEEGAARAAAHAEGQQQQHLEVGQRTRVVPRLDMDDMLLGGVGDGEMEEEEEEESWLTEAPSSSRTMETVTAAVGGSQEAKEEEEERGGALEAHFMQLDEDEDDQECSASGGGAAWLPSERAHGKEEGTEAASPRGIADPSPAPQPALAAAAERGGSSSSSSTPLRRRRPSLLQVQGEGGEGSGWQEPPPAVSCLSPALTPAAAAQAARLAARVSALGRDMAADAGQMQGPVVLRLRVCENPECAAASRGGTMGVGSHALDTPPLSSRGLRGAAGVSGSGADDPVACHLSSALKQAAEMERVIRASLDFDNAEGQSRLREAMDSIAETSSGKGGGSATSTPSRRALLPPPSPAATAAASHSKAAVQPVVLHITVVEDKSPPAALERSASAHLREEEAKAASAAAAAAAAAEVAALTRQFTAQRDAFSHKDRELRGLVSRMTQERDEALRQQALLEASRDDMARLQGQLKGRIAKLEGVVASSDKRVKMQASEIEELRASCGRLTGELANVHAQLDSTPDRCKVANHQLQEQAEWAHRKAREHERRVRKLERMLEREWHDHEELLSFCGDELQVLQAIEVDLTSQLSSLQDARGSHALQLSEERERRMEVDMALRVKEQELRAARSEAAKASGSLAEREGKVAQLTSALEKQAAELQQAAANVRSAESEVDLINQSNETMFRYINYVRGQLTHHSKDLERVPQIAHLVKELNAWYDKEAAERAKSSGGPTAVTSIPAAAAGGTSHSRGGFFKRRSII